MHDRGYGPSPEPMPATGPGPGVPPPRNEMERKLVRLWETLLGTAGIGIHDNFFELGGDSLAGVQLAAQLNQILPVKLSPHVLLENPTIAQLGGAVTVLIDAAGGRGGGAGPGPLPPLVVRLRQGDPSKPPIFLLHPAGGHVYIYRDLCRHLDTDRPVYGIKALGVDSMEEPHQRIDEMAARYTVEMRALQPEGPYTLGGASLGGMLAFDMARQLAALGQGTAALFMIDTPGPGGVLADPGDVTDIFVVRYLLQDGHGVDTAGEGGDGGNLDDYIRHLLEREKKNKLLHFSEEGVRQVRRFCHLFKKCFEAQLRFSPGGFRFPGKIHFFRAMEKLEFAKVEDNLEKYWEGCAEGGVEVYDVPGNHITMNAAPHVEIIAEKLSQLLKAPAAE